MKFFDTILDRKEPAKRIVGLPNSTMSGKWEYAPSPYDMVDVVRLRLVVHLEQKVLCPTTGLDSGVVYKHAKKNMIEGARKELVGDVIEQFYSLWEAWQVYLHEATSGKGDSAKVHAEMIEMQKTLLGDNEKWRV